MRIKYMMVALALTASYPIFAQSESTTPKPDLTGETSDTESIAKQAEGNVTPDGKANWYVTMDYAGFDFQVPAGTIVDKGSTVTAKYPDGTFGLSMVNENTASNQKIAFEICRRLAAQMKIANAKVEKVSYGSSDAARAQGTLDGQDATILVLPHGREMVTAVMLNSPERREWANNFLRTLKR